MLLGQFFNRLDLVQDASGQMDGSLLPAGDGWLTIGSAIAGGIIVVVILGGMACGGCCVTCCGGRVARGLWPGSAPTPDNAVNGGGGEAPEEEPLLAEPGRGAELPGNVP